MTDEDKKKVDGVEAFLKRFKVVLGECEAREGDTWTYDVDVYFDGENLFAAKCGGGSYWDPGHVEEAGGTQIMESMFNDAESYASCIEHGVDDELDALDNFMSEFGYDKVKPAMNAFKGCRAMYEKLKPVVFFNCKWNDENDDSDGSVIDYLYDIVNYFNEQFENEVDKGLVELKWEGDE